MTPLLVPDVHLGWLILFAGWTVVALFGWALVKSGDREISIHDVPCQPCQRGYGEQHECEAPDYCACDQQVKHTNGPDVCEHGARASTCVRCWLGPERS